MSINPERIRERHLNAADGYRLLKMLDHALRELNEFTALGEECYASLMLRGYVLQEKLDHGPALEAFRRAHDTAPTALEPLMGMAWCMKRLDQLPQAIDAMRLAYQFHKEVPVVLYNLACYFALAGEKENSLSWLGRSLRMDRNLLNLIPTETDFDSLRHDSDFQHLLQLSHDHS